MSSAACSAVPRAVLLVRLLAACSAALKVVHLAAHSADEKEALSVDSLDACWGDYLVDSKEPCSAESSVEESDDNSVSV